MGIWCYLSRNTEKGKKIEMKSEDSSLMNSSPSGIFLTGSTGVLGSHILKTLLKTNPPSQIYCLVRAETPEQGLDRLVRVLNTYDPTPELLEEFKRRTVPVLGDLTQTRFGMSEDVYAELQNSIDLTIHAGAYTNLFSKFPVIETINVGGTRNMIDFAIGTRTQRMCYVSTYTVLGDKTFDSSFVFKEEHRDVGQGFAHMSYQETKFIAENLVVKAGDERGLEWTIVRPGQIFGESDSGGYPHGETNVSGLFYDLLKTVLETRTAMDSDLHFDVVPVDYVSRAICHLSQRSDSVGETYHLTNPHVLSWTGLMNVLQGLGYDIKLMSQEDYRHALQNGGLQRDGHPYISVTTKALRFWYKRNFDLGMSATTDCTRTQNILEKAGVFCPKIDEKLLGIYIARGIRENYLPEPDRAVSWFPLMEPVTKLEIAL